MFCQVAFSSSAFARLIQYRIADSFRPLSAPVPFPTFPKGTSSWLDGVLVTHVDLNRIDRDRLTVVNELQGATIAPNSGGYSFWAPALALELTAQMFFARTQDVAAAGTNQPPVHTEPIPVGFLHITVRLTVGLDGVPLLHMELDTARLAALGLPTSILDGLVAAGTATVPFDIGGALNGTFPPGNTKVLNAAITRDDQGAVAMRFEFPGEVWESPMQHVNDWQTFSSAGFKANLGNADWCVDLDGGAIASGIAALVDPELKSKKPIDFSPGYESGFIDDATPRAVVTKHGLIQDACAGNDIHFATFTNVDFTVPSENVLRGTLSVDFTRDAGDLAKCIGLVIVNPLFPIITAFDQGAAGIGFALTAAEFMLPIRPLAIMLGLTVLLTGEDQDVAKALIAQRLKDSPSITKLPDGSFAMDKPLALTNGLTRDWLVLRACTGSNGRMLLTGDLRVPDAVLPRLTASDLEGFTKWVLADRCEPGKGQLANGSVALSLTPGYGTDLAAHQPVRNPTIPLKWGVRPDNGELIFQVVNDPLGVFQDASTEYTQIYVPGIPGLIEVKLEASTLSKARFTPYASSPYPLRLRFFTNGGVREYEFKAPPPFVAFTQTTAQAIARINNCKHRGANLLLRKYIEMLWLGRPPTDRGSVAQQWDIHVRGLAPLRKATVWNQETRQPLVQAFVNRAGRLDLSLVLDGKDRSQSLLLSLDDEPFLPSAEVRRLAAAAGTEAALLTVEIATRQTTLTAIDEIAFAHPVESIRLARSGTSSLASALIVRSIGGRETIHSLPIPYRPGSSPIVPSFGLSAITPATKTTSVAFWRGAQRQFSVFSIASGQTDLLAEYSARSSNDFAVSRDDLFAQVSSDRLRVTLFQKSLPLQSGTYDRLTEEPAGYAENNGIHYESQQE